MFFLFPFSKNATKIRYIKSCKINLKFIDYRFFACPIYSYTSLKLNMNLKK